MRLGNLKRSPRELDPRADSHLASDFSILASPHGSSRELVAQAQELLEVKNIKMGDLITTCLSILAVTFSGTWVAFDPGFGSVAGLLSACSAATIVAVRKKAVVAKAWISKDVIYHLADTPTLLSCDELATQMGVPYPKMEFWILELRRQGLITGANQVHLTELGWRCVLDPSNRPTNRSTAKADSAVGEVGSTNQT